jgi:DNA-binding MarR family transcriptional regulator
LELIVTSLALLAIIVAASILFYRKIKAATIEYENSKNGINGITFGFTRQLNRVQQDLSKLGDSINTTKTIAAEALLKSNQSKEETLKGLEAIKNIYDRVTSTEETLDSLKKEIQKLSQTPKTKIVKQPVALPISVSQSNLIDQLTETEIMALKKIYELNEATGPVIKEHIGLTREHTARMLKKLYESGFVDRTTNAMPFRYSVRREVRDLLIQSNPEQN